MICGACTKRCENDNHRLIRFQGRLIGVRVTHDNRAMNFNSKNLTFEWLCLCLARVNYSLRVSRSQMTIFCSEICRFGSRFDSPLTFWLKRTITSHACVPGSLESSIREQYHKTESIRNIVTWTVVNWKISSWAHFAWNTTWMCSIRTSFIFVVCCVYFTSLKSNTVW